MRFQNLLLVLLQISVAEKTLAFPDTIRHGYTNCTSCHLTPSGGGILNSYGRSLSRELMSSWGANDEEHLLQGLVKIPDDFAEKIFVGGDIRYLSNKLASGAKEDSEGFLMQTQMRLGLVFDKLKFIFSVGKIENPKASEEVKFVSPEYYALWTPKDELYIRIGRFDPIYGLRMPDHELWIKSELGFAPWLERDSLEFVYEGERQFLSVAGFQSTSAIPFSLQQTGYTGTFYQGLGENSRFGFSAINSEGQGQRLKAVSLHATFSFSEKSYLLSEISQVSQLDSVRDISFVRYGYEVAKGLTPFFQGQKKTIKSPNYSDQNKIGAGIIWLPRPHFEFVWQYERQNSASGPADEMFLLIHYYL